MSCRDAMASDGHPSSSRRIVHGRQLQVFRLCDSPYSQRLPSPVGQWHCAGFVLAYGGGTASELHRLPSTTTDRTVPRYLADRWIRVKTGATKWIGNLSRRELTLRSSCSDFVGRLQASLGYVSGRFLGHGSKFDFNVLRANSAESLAHGPLD